LCTNELEPDRADPAAAAAADPFGDDPFTGTGRARAWPGEVREGTAGNGGVEPLLLNELDQTGLALLGAPVDAAAAAAAEFAAAAVRACACGCTDGTTGSVSTPGPCRSAAAETEAVAALPRASRVVRGRGRPPAGRNTPGLELEGARALNELAEWRVRGCMVNVKRDSSEK
jgi:hypothetical protein